jgi:hypothetical protein
MPVIAFLFFKFLASNREHKLLFTAKHDTVAYQSDGKIWKDDTERKKTILWDYYNQPITINGKENINAGLISVTLWRSESRESRP